MLRTVWLSTMTIEIEESRISLDCYGTSEESMLMIASRSYNSITAVIDAWSYHND